MDMIIELYLSHICKVFEVLYTRTKILIYIIHTHALTCQHAYTESIQASRYGTCMERVPSNACEMLAGSVHT